MAVENTLKIFGCSLLAFMLVSCGGSDDSGSEDSGLSDLVGTWAVAAEEANGETDEYYILVSESGSYSVYDYQGDSYDDSGNCYLIVEDVAQVENIDENRYMLIFNDYPDEEYNFTIDLTSDGVILEDDEGETLELTSSTIDLESILSMECTDDGESFSPLMGLGKNIFIP